MVELDKDKGKMIIDSEVWVMDNVTIWYLSDNESGKTLEIALGTVGFNVRLIEGDNYENIDFGDGVNVFIADLMKPPLESVIQLLTDDSRLTNWQKFAIVPADKVETALSLSGNTMHLDFISRPINKREFILLLEKTVVVEKYREMMKSISKDAENRIEAFESLIHIHNKDLFVSDDEKEVFSKIIDFEHRMINEQRNLNNAIRDFSAVRKKEIFDLRTRLQAEEMLEAFRRSEMIEAQETIRAQQAVLELSSKELHTAKTVIQATEITGELSRDEAIHLHEELGKLRDRIAELEIELQRHTPELK